METDKLKDVVVCNEDDSVLEASQILRDTKQRHLVVVNGDNVPQGILSITDINNRVVAEKKSPEGIVVSEVMTKPIDTIEVTDSYDAAYEKMIERNLYSIPVTEDGKLIGLLDFNRLFLKAREFVESEKR